MLNWNDIDTVLLDMDGTLLDLHFDNYFWREYLPLEYARRTGQEVEQVRDYLYKLMDQAYGSIDWYCLDFWTEKLDIDIVSLKREIDHLIALRPAAVEFLEAAHHSSKKVYMITNAHHDALELKLEKTKISHYFDELISSHQYGYIKEQQQFWQKLEQELNFDPKRTLFIDDSLSVLDSAAKFGIAHIYSIGQPDSKQPPIQINDEINNEYGKYPMIDDFSDIIKGLN
jgi:HAD superfamily hydrolase (TIGR01509 family)